MFEGHSISKEIFLKTSMFFLNSLGLTVSAGKVRM